MPKVSIVMPVYNVEPYLAQALESILGQTLEDWELICVNDCSTDDSLSILQRYAKRDSRIRIVENMSNRGAGASRNIGFELSHGEWIMFLDADDYFAADMLEKLYYQAEKDGIDVVYCNHYIRNEKSGIIECPEKYPLFIEKMITGVFAGEDIADYVFRVLRVAPWSKLIRKGFIDANGLYFQDLPSCNDVLFGCCVAVKAKRISYVKEPLVTYRTNHGNQISNKRGFNTICIYESLKAVKRYLDKENLFTVFKKAFWGYVIESIAYAFSSRGSVFSARLKLIDALNKDGWKMFEMESCTEEDFIFRYNYERYLQLHTCSENKYTDVLFNELKNLDMECALWGYGKQGKKFYEAAKLHGFDLKAIIDRDEKKRGTLVDNKYLITPLSESDFSFDAVIVTNRFYGQDVRAELSKWKDCKVKIIDIDSYQWYQLPLSLCIFE